MEQFLNSLEWNPGVKQECGQHICS